MSRKRQTSGFTLVELSISIVIIGLLIAGLTGGMSLIHSAKINSVISDIAEFDSAISLFRTRYNSLPGDIPDAYSYFDPSGTDSVCGTNAFVPTGCNGNGDDHIGDFGGGAGEDVRSWQHLNLAEMLPGNYTGVLDGGKFTVNATTGSNMPSSKIDSGGYWLIFGTSFSKSENYIMFGSESANVLSGAVLSSQDAADIDIKTDDGLANSGRVHSIDGNAVTGCVSGGAYDLTNEAIRCRMIFFIPSGEI